jgi:hypothetical protein
VTNARIIQAKKYFSIFPSLHLLQPSLAFDPATNAKEFFDYD